MQAQKFYMAMKIQICKNTTAVWGRSPVVPIWYEGTTFIFSYSLFYKTKQLSAED